MSFSFIFPREDCMLLYEIKTKFKEEIIMKPKFNATIFHKKETAESYFRTCVRPHGFAQLRYIPAKEVWVVIR